jgi:protein required for attachment to host cells
MNKETLIVVADASGAHFYKTHDRGATVEAATTSLAAGPNPQSHEIMSDRPGRTHASTGTARSAIEPKTDPHQKREDEFTLALARHLDLLVRDTAYQDILIFAPPVFLGVLRKDLSSAVAKKIAGEVHKDLVKSPPEEIRKHVRQALFPD